MLTYCPQRVVHNRTSSFFAAIEFLQGLFWGPHYTTTESYPSVCIKLFFKKWAFLPVHARFTVLLVHYVYPLCVRV